MAVLKIMVHQKSQHPGGRGAAPAPFADDLRDISEIHLVAAEAGWNGGAEQIGRLGVIERGFFFKQKTAYEIVDCDWSSDVCSSDLRELVT